jgi:hypothetical protein
LILSCALLLPIFSLGARTSRAAVELLITQPGASGLLGGQEFHAEDILEYDPVTDVGSLYFDGSAVDFFGNATGIHIVPEPAVGLGLVSGVIALLGLRRVRRR